MAKINILSVFIVTVLISGHASDDSENRREIQNKLREIFGLHGRNLENEQKDYRGKL